MLRSAARLALWLHAALWLIFAGGMIWVAIASPEARENAVFLQVLAGSGLAAAGSVGAALHRRWGIALTLLGGGGVLAAWIAGASGETYRLPVAIALGLFVAIVALDRRAFVRPAAR